MADGESSTDQAAQPITSGQFAELVAGMSRFMDKLAAYAPLKEVGIGLTEWMALVILGKGASSNKALARELGVSKQRVNQITDALKAAGLMDAVRAADDARKTDLSISAAGIARLAEIDSKLTPVLASALQGKERVLGSMTRSLKVLNRTVSPPPTEEAKARRAAKRAGGLASGAVGQG